MKKNLLIILLIGSVSYQCIKPKKYDESITINVPDQFLFVGKNKPMMTVEGTTILPTLTITDQGTTDAEILDSIIKVSNTGTIKVQFTIDTIRVEKEFQVVTPNYVPTRMSIEVPKQPVIGQPQMVELGYIYDYTTKTLDTIHKPTDATRYTKAIELFPQIIKSSILYIEGTSKFTERVTLFGTDLLKVGTYTTTVENPQTDSIRYTFTYQETKAEDRSQVMSYTQHKTTNKITAIVRGATLVYKRQE